MPDDLGISENPGYLFGGPYKKDCSILRSIHWVPLILGNYIFFASKLCSRVTLCDLHSPCTAGLDA